MQNSDMKYMHDIVHIEVKTVQLQLISIAE